MTILSVTGRHAVATGEGHAGRGEGEGRTATRWRPRREPMPTSARASGGLAGLAALGGGAGLAAFGGGVGLAAFGGGVGHRIACHALSSPQSRERMGRCGKISVTFRIRHPYRTN